VSRRPPAVAAPAGGNAAVGRGSRCHPDATLSTLPELLGDADSAASRPARDASFWSRATLVLERLAPGDRRARGALEQLAVRPGAAAEASAALARLPK